MIKRALGAAIVIAGVALAAWWVAYHRGMPGGDGAAAAIPKEDHRWLEGLYSRNPREVQAATDEVNKRGEDALPAILAALRDPRSEAERLKSALKACTILGKRAAPIVDDVASVLAEEGLTAEAAIALSNMGPVALEPLKQGLSSGDPIVRRESLRSIGKLKERAPLNAAQVTPLLTRGLQDSDGSVRAVAATYLGIIGSAPDETVPALTAALGDTDPEVRREAATALGSFGPTAAAAVPALRKASGDDNDDVAREAGRAIIRIQQK